MNTFERLIADHEQSLRNYAKTLTHSEDSAEDIVQDTWLKSIPYLIMLEGMTLQKQRSWLFSVLKNRFLDIRRHRKLEMMQQEKTEPGNVFIRSDFLIERHLDILEPLDREIVYRRYWLGYNSREIAQEMDMPEGTVRWRLKQALDTLRKIIKPIIEKEESWLP
jgi:RNA polymerase sigma-70 factor, ECF subfamily